MAKRAKKLSGGDEIVIRDGEKMPEFPEISIGGWTGTVLESRGRGDGLKYIVEWSEETQKIIPNEFRDAADLQQVATELACVPASAIERTV